MSGTSPSWNRRFTDEEEQEIRKIYEVGLAATRIASAYRCSSSLIYHVLARNGTQMRGSRTGTIVACAHCGKPLYRKPCELRDNKTGKFYCSQNCHYTETRKWRDRACSQCGSKFYPANNAQKYCSRECACIGRSNPDGIANRNKALSGMKRGETVRGYSFELSNEYAILLMESQCYYCGALPMNCADSGYGKGDYLYNGIDRYDDEPYVRKENAVPCCNLCNRAKRKMKGDEFKAWRQRLGPTNYD